MQDRARELAEELDIPGVAVGVLHEETEHYAYHGVTSVENPLPVDATTLEHLPGEIRAALDARPALPPPAPVSPAATSGGGEIGLTAEDRTLRDELVSHLRHHAGNISAVARAMGKDRKQIQRWVKRFGLAPESFR